MILWVILGVLFALAAGFIAGYYYGNSTGLTDGKSIGMSEGRAAAMTQQLQLTADRVKAIQTAANPFASPSATTYVNPFAQ